MRIVLTALVLSVLLTCGCGPSGQQKAGTGASASPSTTLPTVSEQANGSTPGWEDWDADGNPGITLKVTSTLASGMLYTVQRDWTIYDGTTAQASSKFKVAITFNTEQPSLGRSAGASSAIETSAAPSSDLTQHYAWFAKVDAGQLTGTDREICDGVRSLKDTLVPEANQ